MKTRLFCVLCALAVLLSASAFAARAEIVMPVDWFIPLPDPLPGDLDGDGAVTDDDAIRLLMYTFFPEDYPIEQSCDYDGDGAITDDDAIWLLMYTFFPEDYPLVRPEVSYFDVDAAFAASGKKMTDDVSACFPADAAGYLINGGTASKPYLVDADTLFRLTEKPVTGTGTVKWKDFDPSVSTVANPDPFTGVVPVSKLHDPIYMSTALPSEVTTFMTKRINASNLYLPAEKHAEAHVIGAVYRNEDDPPANDDPVTVCLSDFRLLFHVKNGDWILVDSFAAPPLGDSGKVNHMFYLPWQLGLSYIVSSPKVKRYPSNTDFQYIQVAISGSYFNADALVDANGEITVGNPENGSDRKLKNGSLTYKSGGVTRNDGAIAGACLHFWGNKIRFADLGLSPTDVDGMVSAFRIWVKEPEAAGKYGVAIGIDQGDANGTVDQAYSGRNYPLTTEPQWIIGHTVGPKAYDAVMDSEKVQQLIGMK